MSKRVTVKATGKDNGGSGIYSYKFFVKTADENTYIEKDTITVDNSEECTYTYTELSEGISYDLMVEVRDKAGNMVQAKAETFVTKDWKATTGSYVSYTPEEVKTFDLSKEIEPTTGETYAALVSGSGVMTTNQGLKWRVLNIDEENDKLTIISETFPGEQIKLQGVLGYNNGVGTLDKACEVCYSNESMRSYC